MVSKASMWLFSNYAIYIFFKEEKCSFKIGLNYTAHILQRILKIQMKIEYCQLIL